MELKNRVVSGVLWSSAEKFGSLVLYTLVGFILLRFISPSDFGIIATVTVFTLIANTVIDSGFSQALIQKEYPTEVDYDSVFWINICLGLILYFICWGLSYPFAAYYGKPEIVSIAPWLFLSMPLSALGIIQTTKLSKQMDFKRLSKINFCTTVGSSAAAACLAIAGFGLWALVAQTVTLYLVRTLLLWLGNTWRPHLAFSFSSVKTLFSFGSRLFLSGIISQLFNNISVLVIGKNYNMSQAGWYSQPLKLKDSISFAVTQSVQNVTLPAFASMQNDKQKLRLSMREVVNMVSFALFPIMIGLLSVSYEVFYIAGQERWLPGVPYFRVFCLSAVFMPLSVICLNMLKATGEGKVILRLEIIKKSFALIAILVAANISVLALSFAYLLWMFFEMVVNCYYANKKIGYTFAQQLRDISPYLACSAVMLGAVMATGFLMRGASVYLALTVKVAIGIITYTLASFLSKSTAWKETLSLISKFFN